MSNSLKQIVESLNSNKPNKDTKPTIITTTMITKNDKAVTMTTKNMEEA